MQRPDVLLAMIILLGCVTACGPDRHTPVPTADKVTVQAPVAAVEKQPMQDVYEAVGTVAPKIYSTIQSKSTGYVLAVNVREGDRVEAGQVMLEIDARETASQAAGADSALNEALKAGQEMENTLQAAVHAKEAAEAARVLASTTLERYEGLAESRAVTPQAFDEVAAKQKAAEAEAARASEMVLSAEARLGQAAARVEQARAGLENARTTLGYAKVTAPFSGIITRKSVDVGDLAAPGAPLFVLEDPGLYRLEAQVNEEQVNRLATGAKVVVLLDAFTEGQGTDPVPMEGTLSEIVPSAEPASRTFEVKIDLPPNPAIKSGMFGRARFDTDPRQVLIIPEAAVFRRGQLDGVYVVGPGDAARLRLVTVGKRHGSDIEILSGLEPGERIVTGDTARVSDGAIVKQN